MEVGTDEGVVAHRFTEGAVGKSVSEAKLQYSWGLTLDGRPHTIDFTNTRTSGKKRVFVDGRLQHEAKMYMSSKFQYTWPLGNHLLSIVPSDGPAAYELRINGLPFHRFHRKVAPRPTPRTVWQLNKKDIWEPQSVPTHAVAQPQSTSQVSPQTLPQSESTLRRRASPRRVKTHSSSDLDSGAQAREHSPEKGSPLQSTRGPEISRKDSADSLEPSKSLFGKLKTSPSLPSRGVFSRPSLSGYSSLGELKGVPFDDADAEDKNERGQARITGGVAEGAQTSAFDTRELAERASFEAALAAVGGASPTPSGGASNPDAQQSSSRNRSRKSSRKHRHPTETPPASINADAFGSSTPFPFPSVDFGSTFCSSGSSPWGSLVPQTTPLLSATSREAPSVDSPWGQPLRSARRDGPEGPLNPWARAAQQAPGAAVTSMNSQQPKNWSSQQPVSSQPLSSSVTLGSSSPWGVPADVTSSRNVTSPTTSNSASTSVDRLPCTDVWPSLESALAAVSALRAQEAEERARAQEEALQLAAQAAQAQLQAEKAMEVERAKAQASNLAAQGPFAQQAYGFPSADVFANDSAAFPWGEPTSKAEGSWGMTFPDFPDFPDLPPFGQPAVVDDAAPYIQSHTSSAESDMSGHESVNSKEGTFLAPPPGEPPPNLYSKMEEPRVRFVDEVKVKEYLAPPDLQRDPLAWFRFFDVNDNGLERHEIIQALVQTFPDASADVLSDLVMELWSFFDEDASGTITAQEFVELDGLCDSLLAQMNSERDPQQAIAKVATAPPPEMIPVKPQKQPEKRVRSAEEQIQEMLPLTRPEVIRQALDLSNGDKDIAVNFLLTPEPPQRSQSSAGVANGHAQETKAFQSQPSGRKKAFMVGINYVGTRAELRGCVNDVWTMKRLLTQKFGWDGSCIRTLVDEPGHQMPTKANIIAGLRWLVEDVRPGDVLFFHYSGHGAQQEDPFGYEEDGMNETICPLDFLSSGMITDDEIAEIVVRSLPEGVRLTAVMDCCHSGTGLDLPFMLKSTGWREEANPYHCVADVQMFSGCEDEQCSADASDAYGRPAGAMTTAFNDVLTSGNIGQSYLEFVARLGTVMKQRGFKQRPQLTSTQAFDTNRTFSVDEIQPNSNKQLGRIFRKKFSPRPRKQFGPLAEMLGLGAAAAGGFVVADAAASCASGLFDSDVVSGAMGGALGMAGAFSSGIGDTAGFDGGLFNSIFG